MAKKKIETQRMQICFKSDGHQIDSNTLINYLIHYNAIVAEVNNAYGKGDKKISVKVNALREGSFIIDLSLLEEDILNLFSTANLEYLANVVTVIGGIYAVYKYFKGRPIKDEEDKNNATITLTEVNKQQNIEINDSIINIYNSKTVREAVSKSFETVDEDDNVNGVMISDDLEHEPIRFERSEFSSMEYNDFENEDTIPENIEEIVEARLTIISLNFERGHSWQFMYNGFKIYMIVKDDALMERIDNGDRFGKGDSIRVKMKITKQYNKDYKAYENKSYKIVEFLEHIVQPTEGSLF